MLSENEFRFLVDSTHDSVTGRHNDIVWLYDHYGLDHGKVMSQNAIINHLQGSIMSAFSNDPRDIGSHCTFLKRQIICRHVLEDDPLSPYLDIAYIIGDAVGTVPDSQSKSDDWTTAIRFAKDYIKIRGSLLDQKTIRNSYARFFSVAEAINRIRSYGFQIELQDWKPDLSSLEPVAERIHKLVRDLGGINVAFNIFKMLNRYFDSLQERYHIVRHVSTIKNQATPQVPLGYLLQLSAKYPFTGYTNFSQMDADSAWRELIELAIDFAALYDVQPYGLFELMFKDYKTIMPFLQELALYDTLFTFQQGRPKELIKLSKWTAKWLNQYDIKQTEGWSLDEAYDIADAILQLSRPYKGPSRITSIGLQKLCPSQSKDKITNILDTLFSHNPPGANSGFMLPDDEKYPDFIFRPLLSDDQGSYWLLHPSICAPAFLEAILDYLRVNDRELDDKMGNAIEDFVRYEFDNHDITYVGGCYEVNGQAGECDIVVETEDCVIFFEIKKKPLTRKSMAGLDVSILLDLAASLVHAQVQAGRHEVLLRKYGKLELTSILGRTATIFLNNRKIERVALTFLDYGSFQDKIILKQFLDAMLVANFSALDPTLNKKSEELRNNADDLRRQHLELVELGGQEHKKLSFFNCWFLSIPQLLIILDGVKSNSDLKQALLKTRHVFTGSLNFYCDFHQWGKPR